VKTQKKPIGKKKPNRRAGRRQKGRNREKKRRRDNVSDFGEGVAGSICKSNGGLHKRTNCKIGKNKIGNDADPACEPGVSNANNPKSGLRYNELKT